MSGDYGISVTWGAPRPGREKMGLEIWADAIDHAEKLQANGRIAEYDAVIFAPTAGLPAGVFTLWGTREQIDEVAYDKERQTLLMRTAFANEGVSEVRSMRGAALAEGFGDYTAVVQSL